MKGKGKAARWAGLGWTCLALERLTIGQEDAVYLTMMYI